MPTGKIISFLYGEIAPALRFKTNLVSFATGLSKLLNKTVRKSGGVSNRSGFQYVEEPTLDIALNPKGSVRIFGAKLSKQGDESTEREVVFVVPSTNGESAEAISDTPYLLTSNTAFRDLSNVKVSQVGDTLIFSNGTNHWAYKLSTDTIPTGRFEDTLLEAPTAINGAFTGITMAGTAPAAFIRPVNYRIYQVLRTGEEIFFTEFISTAGSFASQPVQLSTANGFNVLTIGMSADAKVKHYNVYRASTTTPGITTGSWGLVGRIPKPVADGNIQFADYLSDSDITNPPPDEDYLYGEGQAALPAAKEIKSARLIGHYQQRRIVVANPATSKLDEGSVAVSRVGTPSQLDTQVLFTPAGAFDFKTPIGVKSRVLAMLELERLVLLTSDAVIVIRGGEQGILTPSTVNPHVISYVGCSEKVAPVQGASYGFFMSKNDERLMRVSFGIDGNVGVDELSLISDHLLEGERVKEMSLTKGKEDIIWMLKRDGTIVSVTVHEGGAITGWARHETDGFVESITSLSVNRQIPINEDQVSESYESLYISVIRDGVRYIERLTYREDAERSQYFYADAVMDFGSRLKLEDSTNQYSRVVDFSGVELPDHVGRKANPTTTAVTFQRMNLTGGVAWDESEDITLTNLDTGNFQDPAIEKQVIDFYYDEGDIEKVIRWTQTGFTSATVASGRLSGLLPESLRDVEGQALTAGEKRLIQTRWLRVKKTITGLTHLANKEVSVFADGIVVSSPNNPTYDTLTVDGAGELELDDYYAWGIVGLPYESEMETLDLDTSDNRTLTDSHKLVNRAGVAFHESKGGYIGQTGSGQDLQNMDEFINREDEELEEVTKNLNEHVVVNFPAEWEKTGRVLIKQVDPLPMTVLAVYPKGIAGD